MRFAIEFELTKNELPVDYRVTFVSFLKSIFKDYDEAIYNQLYKEGQITKKPFTFSLYMGSAKFLKDKISLGGNKIILNFSTYENGLGIHFYNSVLSFLNKEYPLSEQNFMKATRITLNKEYPIDDDTILVKTLSPIIVRQHERESNKDDYILWSHEDFIKVLKDSIESSYKEFAKTDGIEGQISGLVIEPLKMKKTVIFHELKKVKTGMNANLGIMKLQGDRELLDFIVKAGLGSRRGQGFGMMEVIG